MSVFFFYGFFLLAVIADAVRDAYTWDKIHPDTTPLHVSRQFWHPVKNISLACYVLTGYCWQGAFEFIVVMPLLFVVWRITYTGFRHLPTWSWYLNITELTSIQQWQHPVGKPIIFSFTERDGYADYIIKFRDGWCVAVFTFFVMASIAGLLGLYT